MGLSAGRRLYVIGKDAPSNTVTLGERERLLVSGCVAHEANWLGDPPPPGAGVAVLARYRSNGALVPATLRSLGATLPGPSGRTGAFEVGFESPQEAVAPGQALVLYDATAPDLVLGGGWIDRVIP